MNDRMGTVFPARTTRAAWKKSHPTEVAACDKESGWPTLRRRRRSHDRRPGRKRSPHHNRSAPRRARPAPRLLPTPKILGQETRRSTAQSVFQPATLRASCGGSRSPPSKPANPSYTRWRFFVPCEKPYSPPVRETCEVIKGVGCGCGGGGGSPSPLCDRSGGDPVRRRGTSGRARAWCLDAGR